MIDGNDVRQRMTSRAIIHDLRSNVKTPFGEPLLPFKLSV